MRVQGSSSEALAVAAQQWWYNRLNYYEIRTKEGIIAHPRSIHWEAVYREEFIPFMCLCGHQWKELKAPDDTRNDVDEVSSKEKGSMATWYKGRK